MSDGLAPNTLANDMGFIRDDIVAAHIDALGIDLSAGQADGSKRKVVVLQLQNDITPKDKLLTQTLVDSNGSTLLIPSGSTIEEVIVCKNPSASLPDDLVMVLGYLCNDLASLEAKKLLAGRIASTEEPITGRLLNKHKMIKICQRLTKAKLEAENALYAADAASQGLPVETEVNYGVVADGVCVGEAKDLYPCSTIINGVVAKKALSIIFVFCPAC